MSGRADCRGLESGLRWMGDAEMVPVQEKADGVVILDHLCKPFFLSHWTYSSSAGFSHTQSDGEITPLCCSHGIIPGIKPRTKFRQQSHKI